LTATPLEAATVVLMRDRAPGQGGPEVLLVERHGASTVGAGAFVFPGGVVERQDRAPEAVALAAALAAPQRAALAERMEGLGDADAALAHRLAAARETFEETLLLLADPLPGAALPPAAERERARAAMIAGDLRFADWIAASGLGAALADTLPRLVYFAHWITPRVVPQRFDARFFLLPAPVDDTVVPDRTEILSHRWLAPAEAIALRGRGELRMMEPTARNLALLGQFASTAEALRELNRRAVPAILPQVQVHPDGSRRLLFPGDADYEQGEAPAGARGELPA